jgi:hypothetical protein
VLNVNGANINSGGSLVTFDANANIGSCVLDASSGQDQITLINDIANAASNPKTIQTNPASLNLAYPYCQPGVYVSGGGVFQAGNTHRLVADKSISDLTPGTTANAFVSYPLNFIQFINVHCSILWQQTAAVSSVGLSVAVTGDTPTYLAASAAMWPKSGAAIAPNVGNISVTTTTISPVISGVTPNAATTTYNAEMDIDVECNGQISPSNCGHSTQANLYIMGFTGNVLDPIVLKRGTACYVLP